MPETAAAPGKRPVLLSAGAVGADAALLQRIVHAVPAEPRNALSTGERSWVRQDRVSWGSSVGGLTSLIQTSGRAAARMLEGPSPMPIPQAARRMMVSMFRAGMRGPGSKPCASSGA
ncbi:MAG TPA: hypothetical protein VG123_17535, partial [Streptosporangiaceae bacterium]|nr:hypothetical protein [Streptosporangiaceae bacterium]